MAFTCVDDLYLYELEVQSGFAELAWDAALKALSIQDSENFWLALQGVLISAGNVSKILWPYPKHAERGQRLRQLLRVDEHSILHDRSFRNHFEHFDERLQKWFDSDRPAGFGDHNIGPVNSFGGGVNKPHWLRNFDPAKNELYFAGETSDLKALLTEVKTIRSKAISSRG